MMSFHALANLEKVGPIRLCLRWQLERQLAQLKIGSIVAVTLCFTHCNETSGLSRISRQSGQFAVGNINWLHIVLMRIISTVCAELAKHAAELDDAA